MRGYLHDVVCNKGVYDFVFVMGDTDCQKYEVANTKTIRLDLTQPIAKLTFSGRPLPCRALDADYTRYFKRELQNEGNWKYAFARAIFITYDYIVDKYRSECFGPDHDYRKCTFEEFVSKAFKWIEQCISICKSTDKKEKEVTEVFKRNVFKTSFEWRLGRYRDFDTNYKMVETSPAEIFKDLTMYSEYAENHNWTYYGMEEVFMVYLKMIPVRIFKTNLKDYQTYKDNYSTIDKLISRLTCDYDSVSGLQKVVSAFTSKDWYNLNKIVAEIHPMSCLGSDFMSFGVGLFKACHALDRQLDSGSIFKQANIIAKEYEQAQTLLNKELVDECNSYFKDCQTNGIDLNFEDDHYKVIVPTTYQELVKMGSLMRNCLADHEWINLLTTGDRRVVFIQPKDKNNKKHIACDIEITTGSIQQFLTDCNENVDEEDFPYIEEFREEYEGYIESQYFVDCDKLPSLDKDKANKIRRIFSAIKSEN